MGNAESSGAAPGAGGGPVNRVGYHILQVQPGSPSSDILFPFWDVIVGSGQQIFDREDSRLVDLFQAHVGQPLALIVYSLRTERTREVTIIPNNNWGGSGLVGISIRFCKFDVLLELVWHVLDVYMSSPASDAKLQTRTDYIIGVPERLFNDPEDFFNHINANMRKSVKLYVYNSASEDVRVVEITPNNEWGGSGSLGCDIGYGYLHRIPARTNPHTPKASPSLTALPPPAHPPQTPPPAQTAAQPAAFTPTPVPPVFHSPAASLPATPVAPPPTASPTHTVPAPAATAAPAAPTASAASAAPAVSAVPAVFPTPPRFSPTPFTTAPPSSILQASPAVMAHYSPTYPLSPYSSPGIHAAPAPYTPPPLPTPPPLFQIPTMPTDGSPLQKNTIMTPMSPGEEGKMEQVGL